MTKNEVTTTLRISERKYKEFKDYAEETSVSINSLLKAASAIGLKIMKGEFQNVALVDNPEQI